MTEQRRGRGKVQNRDEWRQCREETKRRRRARGAKKTRGRKETATVRASVAESWSCLLAQRVHMSLGERRGGERREGKTLERAMCARPPPCPLVASCSTSGDLYVNLTESCQSHIFYIPRISFTGFARVQRAGGGKISASAKHGV